MRCSSCEPLLAEYVDGTLTPRRMADVAKHVHACSACSALVDELKVIDALLATTQPVELPTNFTFAVMAHVRSMPVPQRRGLSVWVAAAGYLVAAWGIAAAFYVARGTAAFVAVERALAPLDVAWNAFSAALSGAAHAVAPNAAALGLTVGTVLALDAIALVGLFYFYRSVRPRLRAAVTIEARR